MDCRTEFLPQQFQDVIRVFVSWLVHPIQMYGQEVGVGRDVGGRAVELIESKPKGVWIYLD